MDRKREDYYHWLSFALSRMAGIEHVPMPSDTAEEGWTVDAGSVVVKVVDLKAMGIYDAPETDVTYRAAVTWTIKGAGSPVGWLWMAQRKLPGSSTWQTIKHGEDPSPHVALNLAWWAAVDFRWGLLEAPATLAD